MIHFQCPHCDQKIKVPDAHAGKAGRCPRCKNRVAVPPASEPELALVDEQTPAAAKPPDRPPFPAPEAPARRREDLDEHQRAQDLLAFLGPRAAPEPTGERKTSWPLDILLYPTSLSGAITLAVLVGLPLLLALVQRLIPIRTPLSAWPFFLIDGVIALYAAWYLAECVYDSAKGGTRAPEVFDADTRLGTMWSRVSYLLAVYIVFVAPAVLYRSFLGGSDAIFWGLAAWAIIFFPIGLLAMVIQDSISALNPFFLLGSILRVFFPYLGLLVVLAAFGVLYWLIVSALFPGPASIWLDPIELFVGAYLSFVLAHVLGRFYWRYRDRLDWGI